MTTLFLINKGDNDVKKVLKTVVGKCNMIRLIVTAILLTLASTAQAELYYELDIENGGDTLIATTSGQEINAGSGLKFALGVQNEVGENGKSLSLSLGYMFQNLDASNGTAEINTLTLDAIYSIRKNSHRFGIGAIYHVGPTYEDNIAGFSPLKIEFDDALGLILQYAYTLNNGIQIGARFTDMDYKVNGLSLDASSVGLFISNGF